ncbi:MAG: hypothetical protein AAGE65_01675 [Planctomycetota bacterium]
MPRLAPTAALLASCTLAASAVAETVVIHDFEGGLDPTGHVHLSSTEPRVNANAQYNGGTTLEHVEDDAGNTVLHIDPSTNTQPGPTYAAAIDFQWADLLAAGFDRDHPFISFDLSFDGDAGGGYHGLVIVANTSDEDGHSYDQAQEGAYGPTATPRTFEINIADLVPFLDDESNTYSTVRLLINQNEDARGTYTLDNVAIQTTAE